jgi:hypothetical protein
MPVDPQQGLAIRAAQDFVAPPDFFQQGLGGHVLAYEQGSSSFPKKTTKRLLFLRQRHDPG